MRTFILFMATTTCSTFPASAKELAKEFFCADLSRWRALSGWSGIARSKAYARERGKNRWRVRPTLRAGLDGWPRPCGLRPAWRGWTCALKGLFGWARPRGRLGKLALACVLESGLTRTGCFVFTSAGIRLLAGRGGLICEFRQTLASR